MDLEHQQTLEASNWLREALELHRQGRLDNAQALYSAILAKDPLQLDALQLNGALELQRGNLEKALKWLDLALVQQPQTAHVHANRGAALRQLGRLHEALDSLGTAMKLATPTPEALNTLAAVLLDLGHAQDAMHVIERSLAISSLQPAALYNRVSALVMLRREHEAANACEQALALMPEDVELLNHQGNLLRASGQVRKALESYEHAARVAPQHAGVLVNRGHALTLLGDHERAELSYRQAILLQPEMPLLAGYWLHARLRTCNWDGIDLLFEHIAQGVDADAQVCEPFLALFTPLSAAQQRRCAELHVRTHWPEVADPIEMGERAGTGSRRIRLGYFSADFHNHPTAHLIAGLIEQHDRHRFEIFGFSLGPPDSSAVRSRLKAAFDQFLELDRLSEEETVARARDCKIDVAIDLGGHTYANRFGIFARRVAPVQIGWLGFAGTSGAPFIDYCLVDAVVAPPGSDGDFTEKVYRLPNCYQVNDSCRPPPTARECPSRQALGLPPRGFVWCCFSNPAKITPVIFKVWMRLLLERSGSVLWLLQGNDAATRNLQREALAQGVNPSRLVFAPRLDLPDHLARHAQADLFLDTWPYGAHTTASDSLWAGVPLLTLCGESFPSRVAASVLLAAGLPELVTYDLAHYEREALRLSGTSAPLRGLRQRLTGLRCNCALFDTQTSTRTLETALLTAWENVRSERHDAAGSQAMTSRADQS